MLRKIGLAALVFVSFWACEKASEEPCDPPLVETKWKSGKSIEFVADTIHGGGQFLIVEGADRLFHYQFTDAQCDYINDDEQGATLVFTVGEMIADFEFSNEELSGANAYYRPWGAWVPYNNVHLLRTGTIKGTQLSEGQWQVRVDVVTMPLLEWDAADTLRFTRVFE